MNNFEQKLAAGQMIMSFMGTLALRYDSTSMKKLWQAMDLMRARYGDIFVAEAIKKDSTDAELALFRYFQKHEKDLPQPEEEIPEVRWHRAYPKQRNIARRFVALIALMLLALVIYTITASQVAIHRSDEILNRTAVYMDLRR